MDELLRQAMAAWGRHSGGASQASGGPGGSSDAQGQDPAHGDAPRWWEVLGVSPGASAAEVLATYRSRAKEHHPDCGGDPPRFKRVRAAYEEARRR